MNRTIDQIADALAAPFERSEVKFKPQSVSGNRAMAVAFVDARVVQDRLDDVLGVMGWQDSYECLPDGSVVCRLRIRLGDEWITKEDVGGQSEQPDEGDRRKAAFSDALKRAAVKFGVGRYLYRHKPQWCDYDPQKRRFVKDPVLPSETQSAKQPQQPPQKPQSQAQPNRQPATQKPAQPTAARLERPYDADYEEAEIIKPDMAAYLLQTAAEYGHTREQLKNRFGSEPEQMMVGDYRYYLEGLVINKLPKKAAPAA